MGLVARARAALRAMLPDRTPAYPQAGRGRRFAGFGSTRAGVNAALLGNIEILRDRAHQLMRENPYIWRGVTTLVANLIGTGIRPQSSVKDDAMRQAIHELWTAWAKDADADGRTDFYGIQKLVAQAKALSGEVFVRIRPRRFEDGLAVPLQLQVLEADHCPVWKTEALSNGNVIKAGIEFNGIGKRVAYWMYREHPTDAIGASTTGNVDLVRVSADQVLHIFDAIRPNQLRGEPRLARVLLTASDLEMYDNAELKRKQVAATITGWIKKQPGIDGLPLVDNDAEGDTAGTVEQKMELGTLSVLNEGEDITFAPSADVGQTYDDFERRTLLRLAAGIGITYEQLTGDMLNVNYSSARVALIEFRRLCEQDVYTGFVPQLCDPVFRAFMIAAVQAGLIPGLGIREFTRNLAAYTAAEWVMTKWDWIDPQKEITAFRESVRCGFQTRSEIIRSLGNDPEQVDREMAADQARADALALTLDTDGRASHPQPMSAPASDAPAAETRRAA